MIVKEIEREIPNINEYGKPEEFYEIFDRYEKPVIEARNQIAEEITQEYLLAASEAAKKGAKKGNAK